MSLLIGYLIQVFVFLLSVWILGIPIYAIAMAFTERKRAAYRLKLGMGSGSVIYDRKDWIVRPAAWPFILSFRFFDWLDDSIFGVED